VEHGCSAQRTRTAPERPPCAGGAHHPLLVDHRGLRTTIETEDEVVARLRRAAPRPGHRRLVCLGSSQTWGAGARRADEAWPARLERLLNGSLRPGERPWACVNTGISGAVAERIFELYRREWSMPEPELVVVDLSNNDRDREAFRRALEELVAWNRARGIPTLLVLEPNSLESISHELEPNHRIMRQVGAATGTPVVDMMAALAAEPDAGFLWWDGVHLTSFGHRRFAEILHGELRRLGR